MPPIDPLQQKAHHILANLGINDTRPLPQGGEGLLFVYGDRVIKIYNSYATRSYLEQLTSFQSQLRSYHFSFATPRVEEICELDGTLYTIEPRLSGEQLDQRIGDLSPRERHTVFSNYYAAWREIAAIELTDLPYGQIFILTDALTAPTWPEFLVRKLRQCALQALPIVRSEVKDFAKKANHLEQLITNTIRTDARNLVHADYYLNNVLITDDLSISAVLDFSVHAAVGDARYDLMSVLRWNTINPRVQAKDYAFLEKQAEQDYGSDIHSLADIYLLYSGFYFADMEDPSFSIRTLNDEHLWKRTNN
jgi:hypothetical protein